MHIHLSESQQQHDELLPLTYTRPVAAIKIGILSIAEKWARQLAAKSFSYGTSAYLAPSFPTNYSSGDLQINAGLLPNTSLIHAISQLPEHGSLRGSNGDWLARRGGGNLEITFTTPYNLIKRTWDIFRWTRQEIENDFAFLTKGRKSGEITDPHSVVYGNQLFVEDGVQVRSAIIDTEQGPVYLDRNSEVHEGAVIKGAFYLGEGSQVNAGAKIRGDTSIGHYCKVGGEVSNSALLGYCNKAHDGFLGNSVIGEWCNLGAGTNNSNLKNNYSEIKMWDYLTGSFIETGLQFCGLIMGDHSKCGINTMFNTGTTVGTSANIFGSGFPRNVIPSFSWGGASGFSTYQLNKALDTARLVMERRNVKISTEVESIMSHIFTTTASQRVWEKK